MAIAEHKQEKKLRQMARKFNDLLPETPEAAAMNSTNIVTQLLDRYPWYPLREAFRAFAVAYEKKYDIPFELPQYSEPRNTLRYPEMERAALEILPETFDISNRSASFQALDSAYEELRALFERERTDMPDLWASQTIITTCGSFFGDDVGKFAAIAMNTHSSTNFGDSAVPVLERKRELFRMARYLLRLEGTAAKEKAPEIMAVIRERNPTAMPGLVIEAIHAAYNDLFPNQQNWGARQKLSRQGGQNEPPSV